MKHYTQPILRIVNFNVQDVITASSATEPEYQDDPFTSVNDTTIGGI